jgi:hypothetical protein
MSLSSFHRPYSIGRSFPARCLAIVVLVTLFSSACGQDAVTEDVAPESTPDMADVTAQASAEAVKASFIADVEVMREKFIGLAEAFPEETYTWRPMDGVRSVSEVLMLIAGEGYGFAPTAFGGTAAMSREEAGALSEITAKAEVIDHLNKGFDHAMTELEAVDAASLVGSRELFGQERTTPAVALLVAGDMHEHLGQLIAYARANEIVPPWSE